MVRREAVDDVVFDRESELLSEKKRRVEELRFGGRMSTGGESGGEFGPRSAFRR